MICNDTDDITTNHIDALFDDEFTLLPEYLLQEETIEITVNRNQILQDMFLLYDDPLLLFKRIKVSFLNEEGDDFGGLTKELFTVFWGVCIAFV